MEAQRDAPVRVFVVWEPVLIIDWMAPSTTTLGRISDVRAQQYWDKKRFLSKAMGEKDSDSIVWDIVAVYPRGQVWSEAKPPEPLFSEGSVADAIPGFKGALAQALAGHAKP